MIRPWLASWNRLHRVTDKAALLPSDITIRFYEAQQPLKRKTRTELTFVIPPYTEQLDAALSRTNVLPDYFSLGSYRQS
ncbi:hypothetical protein DTO280E4_8015 [Paecilomyces variotii]|nr:hypothetical protein DTO280E4_8015 [Paecilomyces variotii]